MRRIKCLQLVRQSKCKQEKVEQDMEWRAKGLTLSSRIQTTSLIVKGQIGRAKAG